MPYLPPAVRETDQSRKLATVLGPAKQGKVRDIWDLGEHLFISTSDRVSSDDHVLGQHVPKKGYVLNLLSVWWFVVGLKDNYHHLEAYGSDIDSFLPKPFRGNPDRQARSVVVQKRIPEPVEFVVRGYLTGSGWKDYQAKGSVCGVELPKGLRNGDRLPSPIFTPATKAEVGHDINITEVEAAKLVGGPVVLSRLKERAYATYSLGAAVAEERGIILADTKFEMDRSGRLLDELLTPDSSRYWPRDIWQQMQASGGGTPPSMDKQYLRDYLKQFNFANLTDKQAGEIVLSQDVLDTLSGTYVDVLTKLTGTSLPGLQDILGVEFIG